MNLILLWTEIYLINGLSFGFEDNDDMKNFLNVNKENDDHGDKFATNKHYAYENFCIALTYRSPQISYLRKLYEFLNNESSLKEFCSFNKFKFFLSDKSDFDKELVRKIFCNYYDHSDENNFSIITKTKHNLDSTYDADVGDKTNFFAKCASKHIYNRETYKDLKSCLIIDNWCGKDVDKFDFLSRRVLSLSNSLDLDSMIILSSTNTTTTQRLFLDFILRYGCTFYKSDIKSFVDCPCLYIFDFSLYQNTNIVIKRNMSNEFSSNIDIQYRQTQCCYDINLENFLTYSAINNRFILKGKTISSSLYDEYNRIYTIPLDDMNWYRQIIVKAYYETYIIYIYLFDESNVKRNYIIYFKQHLSDENVFLRPINYKLSNKIINYNMKLKKTAKFSFRYTFIKSTKLPIFNNESSSPMHAMKYNIKYWYKQNFLYCYSDFSHLLTKIHPYRLTRKYDYAINKLEHTFKIVNNTREFIDFIENWLKNYEVDQYMLDEFKVHHLSTINHSFKRNELLFNFSYYMYEENVQNILHNCVADVKTLEKTTYTPDLLNDIMFKHCLLFNIKLKSQENSCEYVIFLSRFLNIYRNIDSSYIDHKGFIYRNLSKNENIFDCLNFDFPTKSLYGKIIYYFFINLCRCEYIFCIVDREYSNLFVSFLCKFYLIAMKYNKIRHKSYDLNRSKETLHENLSLEFLSDLTIKLWAWTSQTKDDIRFQNLNSYTMSKDFTYNLLSYVSSLKCVEKDLCLLNYYIDTFEINTLIDKTDLVKLNPIINFLQSYFIEVKKEISSQNLDTHYHMFCIESPI